MSEYKVLNNNKVLKNFMKIMKLKKKIIKLYNLKIL